MEDKDFWDYAEEITEDHAMVKRGLGVGIDMTTRTIVLSIDGKIHDIDIAHAKAMALALGMAANALTRMIAETN
jgi:hypothetical protein